MKEQFKKQLENYLVQHNPELIISLQHRALDQYMEEKLARHLPQFNAFIVNGKACDLISRVVMKVLTADLRPSKYDYLHNLLKEEFTEDYLRLRENGTLTQEIVQLIALCTPIFSSLHFSEAKLNDKLIRHAICWQIDQYLHTTKP
ncbi:hypothetical protein CPT03_13490 [Pedobacter ginsengisoli]|uniref:Uncharacterized protein n=1 Tax=Pedobacter ginsengisoli TaxID=363852 RepID=A0A2D1U724_9SPHI|nr:DUF1896 family protein [Pedobacter ginsengisoli]ATP57411.1 hypothetical protein CPT03_13490 [Pedobacter ginsengisoli]